GAAMPGAPCTPLHGPLLDMLPPLCPLSLAGTYAASVWEHATTYRVGIPVAPPAPAWAWTSPRDSGLLRASQRARVWVGGVRQQPGRGPGWRSARGPCSAPPSLGNRMFAQTGLIENN